MSKLRGPYVKCVDVQLIEKVGTGLSGPCERLVENDGQRGVAEWGGDKNIASNCKRCALWEACR